MACGGGAKEYRERVRTDAVERARVVAGWKARYAPHAGEHDCWLSGLAPTKANGYVQGTWEGRNHFALMHVVAAWAGHGGDGHAGMQASHLCHSPTCFNPRHLCFESAKANNARKGCVGVVVDETGRKHRVCLHTPPCLVTTLLADFPATD